MCGRVALKHYKWENPPNYLPRTPITHFDLAGVDWKFNVAPTLTIPILRTTDSGIEAVGARWWLVPRFVTDVKAWKPTTFNARSEDIHTTRTFKGLWQRGQRCVIPVAGMYEWDRQQSPSQPYAFTRRDDTWMLLGGLYEDGPTGVSCTILTMAANTLFAPIHDRMPLAFGTEDEALHWLDPDVDHEQARAMLAPWDPAPYQAWPVSRVVSSSRNDGPECLEPVAME